MKQISNFINESNELKGSSFEAYRYENAEWNKWLKLINKEDFGKDILIGNYD